MAGATLHSSSQLAQYEIDLQGAGLLRVAAILKKYNKCSQNKSVLYNINSVDQVPFVIIQLRLLLCTMHASVSGRS